MTTACGWDTVGLLYGLDDPLDVQTLCGKGWRVSQEDYLNMTTGELHTKSNAFLNIGGAQVTYSEGGGRMGAPSLRVQTSLPRIVSENGANVLPVDVGQGLERLDAIMRSRPELPTLSRAQDTRLYRADAFANFQAGDEVDTYLKALARGLKTKRDAVRYSADDKTVTVVHGSERQKAYSKLAEVVREHHGVGAADARGVLRFERSIQRGKYLTRDLVTAGYGKREKRKKAMKDGSSRTEYTYVLPSLSAGYILGELGNEAARRLVRDMLAQWEVQNLEMLSEEDAFTKALDACGGNMKRGAVLFARHIAVTRTSGERDSTMRRWASDVQKRLGASPVTTTKTLPIITV